jgi:hypothetical protein
VRLEGWHLIVLLGLLVVLAVIVGIVLLVAAARRGPRADVGQPAPGRPVGPPQQTPQDTRSKEQRLREVDDLLRRGVISETESRETRKRILEN